MTTRNIGPLNKLTLLLDERRLAPQSIERLPGMHAGDAIACTCGVLWVTQAGDPEDYVLRRGSVFVANRQGLVLVQALSQAAYCLSRHRKMEGRMRLELDGKPRTLNIERACERLHFARQGQRVLEELVSKPDENGSPAVRN